MKTVVAVGADLGIAHDGDADRMITVDENGNISPFDSLLALISKEFDGDVVTTVDAGLCMDESVSGKVFRTPVGDVKKSSLKKMQHLAESRPEHGFILISACVLTEYCPVLEWRN